MPFFFRFTTYAACAVVGAAIPLFSGTDLHQTAISPSLAFHSSSRIVAMDAMAPSAELEQLRNQIWSLTQHGGTIHCSAKGVTAPCVDSSALHHVD